SAFNDKTPELSGRQYNALKAFAASSNAWDDHPGKLEALRRELLKIKVTIMIDQLLRVTVVPGGDFDWREAGIPEDVMEELKACDFVIRPPNFLYARPWG